MYPYILLLPDCEQCPSALPENSLPFPKTLGFISSTENEVAWARGSLAEDALLLLERPGALVRRLGDEPKEAQDVRVQVFQ